MVGGDLQKDFLESNFHRHGIEHPVGARNVAAMMVVRSGILIVVIGGKFLSVGIGFAMGGTLVLLTMRVAVNNTRPKPCEDAEEK
ncbi:MAG: hypothetical protein NWR08_01810 [Opitutales bacterium]|jgi:hypothetical protein|nr:hypothetical protein [Opitutales bacterium]